MKTQFDSTARLVALENLRAMCERVSGIAYRFAVANVSANRVTVSHSNPNEYGSNCPILVSFPCYGDRENPFVVLDIVRVTGGRDEMDRDGATDTFYELTHGQTLWRDPVSGNWQTEYEIYSKQFPQFTVSSQWDKAGCVQTWYCNGETFTNWRAAQDRAVELAKQARDNARKGGNAQ